MSTIVDALINLDTDHYLSMYRDVQISTRGMSDVDRKLWILAHFVKHGYAENRKHRLKTTQPLQIKKNHRHLKVTPTGEHNDVETHPLTKDHLDHKEHREPHESNEHKKKEKEDKHRHAHKHKHTKSIDEQKIVKSSVNSEQKRSQSTPIDDHRLKMTTIEENRSKHCASDSKTNSEPNSTSNPKTNSESKSKLKDKHPQDSNKEENATADESDGSMSEQDMQELIRCFHQKHQCFEDMKSDSKSKNRVDASKNKKNLFWDCKC